MTALQALYDILSRSHSFVIEFQTNYFHFYTGITDKLHFTDCNEIIGDHITIKNVKNFIVQKNDEFETTSLLIAFEDSATVKIHCI